MRAQRGNEVTEELIYHRDTENTELKILKIGKMLCVFDSVSFFPFQILDSVFSVSLW